MKLLNGKELAEFIKEQQYSRVKRLNKKPKLVILKNKGNPVIDKYVSLKQLYGQDLDIIVEVLNLEDSEMKSKILVLNDDETVDGIIVQLPLKNIEKTDEIVNLIAPKKDVDSLGRKSIFDAATPKAIMWLLAGYNIELYGKNIVIIGLGRLVGKPLKKMLEKSEIEPKIIDIDTKNSDEILANAQIIISAVGKPSILTVENIPNDAVVIDAGVTSEDGVLKGDVDEAVYEQRDDLKITPKIGGVGPLTVAALFDNLILATEKQSK